MNAILRYVTRHRLPSLPWTDIAPVREELFGVERLEQHAESLAAAQAITKTPPAEREAMSASSAERAPPDSSRRSVSASASARALRPAVIWSVRRRRFSISTMRSVIATAHNSPIVSG